MVPHRMGLCKIRPGVHCVGLVFFGFFWFEPQNKDPIVKVQEVCCVCGGQAEGLTCGCPILDLPNHLFNNDMH